MNKYSATIPVSRRRALQLGACAALAATVPWGLAGCTSRQVTERLVVAGGEPGGLYQEFATLLASALQRYEVAEVAESRSTEASRENMDLLLNGQADFGLALADSVAAAPAVTDGSLVALGRIYQNYFHCVVRRTDPIHSLDDLAGKVIGTGAPGSGTWLTGQRVLTAAGLKEGAKTIQDELQLGYTAGSAALRAGSIDALFISGGIALGNITTLNQDVEIRLLDLGETLPAMRSAHPGFYERVVIPQDTYAGAGMVNTVGVANLLLCRATMEEEVVERTVHLLVDRAQELIPTSSAGIQYLSAETLISTAGQPLHPAAARAYRSLHG